MADMWLPLMRSALFHQLQYNGKHACSEANCSIIYGPVSARFRDGTSSSTHYQADASLWKGATFFDAGTFCLPSQLPKASLESYNVEYDLATGVHHVALQRLTLRQILSLVDASAPKRSNHVAEFSDGVMFAMPKSGSSVITPHATSRKQPASNLQEVDPAILSMVISNRSETSEFVGARVPLMQIDDAIVSVGGDADSTREGLTHPHRNSNDEDASALDPVLAVLLSDTKTKFSPERPPENFNHRLKDAVSSPLPVFGNGLFNEHLTASTKSLQEASFQETDGKARSSSGSRWDAESSAKKLTAFAHNQDFCPRKPARKNINSLHVRTDLAVQHESLLSSSRTLRSSSDGAFTTQLTPITSATSSTSAQHLDLAKINVPGYVSQTISALDLNDKGSEPVRRQSLDLPWLSLEVSSRQYELWDNFLDEEEPELQKEDQIVHGNSQVPDYHRTQVSNSLTTAIANHDDKGFQTATCAQSSQAEGSIKSSQSQILVRPITRELVEALPTFAVKKTEISQCCDALDLPSGEEKCGCLAMPALQHLNLDMSSGKKSFLEPLRVAHTQPGEDSVVEITFNEEDGELYLLPIGNAPVLSALILSDDDVGKPQNITSEEPNAPMRLEDIDLDAEFRQSVTELDDEAAIEDVGTTVERTWLDEHGPEEEMLTPGTEDRLQFHHYNLLYQPVYQASRTPSALSLWVAMASTKKAQIEDRVSWKAVVSSQAARWIDPCLMHADISVPAELLENGNATALRNFFTGAASIQYDPAGTWLSDIYDSDQEIPEIIDSSSHQILQDAYEDSDGYPGLQRPYYADMHDGGGRCFASAKCKQNRGWQSLERCGNSNLRYVLDAESIMTWNDPAATSIDNEDGTMEASIPGEDDIFVPETPEIPLADRQANALAHPSLPKDEQGVNDLLNTLRTKLGTGNDHTQESASNWGAVSVTDRTDYVSEREADIQRVLHTHRKPLGISGTRSVNTQDSTQKELEILSSQPSDSDSEPGDQQADLTRIAVSLSAEQIVNFARIVNGVAASNQQKANTIVSSSDGTEASGISTVEDRPEDERMPPDPIVNEVSVSQNAEAPTMGADVELKKDDTGNKNEDTISARPAFTFCQYLVADIPPSQLAQPLLTKCHFEVADIPPSAGVPLTGLMNGRTTSANRDIEVEKLPALPAEDPFAMKDALVTERLLDQYNDVT